MKKGTIIAIVIVYAVALTQVASLIIRNTKSSDDDSRLYLSFSEIDYQVVLGKNYINGTVKNLDLDDYSLDDLSYRILGSQLKYSVLSSGMLPTKFYDCTLKYFSYQEEIQNVYMASPRYLDLHELYIEASFNSTASYINEINRLSKIEHKKTGNYIPLSANLFELPAYLFIYNWNSYFQYAIIDDTNEKIYYISFSNVEFTSNLIFYEGFHPTKMLTESDVPTDYIEDGYYYDNIYYYREGVSK